MYAFALPRENRSSKICVKINRKPEQNIPNIIDRNLEERLTDFNNIWQKNFRHNWVLNKCFSFHLTKRLLLHYLGKGDQA